ncbi:alpha/beta hydrolase [Nocardia sp. NPDC051030]|uniref:alpha/beta fold hydrolase n=1 Tax=Nocardia sp. NPDC051030 TaxID=3155162 RepID=UPI00342C52DD
MTAVHTPPTHRYTVAGHRLAYDIRGTGDHTVVLVPGILMSRRMQWPLADELAAAGLRVVTLDPLGHGESDRPTEYSDYTMRSAAGHVVALLDELGLEKAVVLGTSAGSLITMALAGHAPARLHGIVLEGPVLDHSMPFGAACFAFLSTAWTVGRPLSRLVSRVAAHAPRGFSVVPDLTLDWLAQDSDASLAGVQGLMLGGPKPGRDVLAELAPRTLVIGYRLFDPIHRGVDARELVDIAPDARLERAWTWLDLRYRPQRLVPRIADFVVECYAAGERREAVSA